MTAKPVTQACLAIIAMTEATRSTKASWRVTRVGALLAITPTARLVSAVARHDEVCVADAASRRSCSQPLQLQPAAAVAANRRSCSKQMQSQQAAAFHHASWFV